MTDLSRLDATAQAELVRAGDISARECVAAAIARIEAVDGRLNALVARDFERALEAAETVDRRAPFAGVPFLVKDMAQEVAGLVMTEGSRFLGDHVSPADTELVRRYRRAGLVVLGKTNTPEFAMMPTTEPARFGPTRNPWDPERSPGGSSGGSAAAVASGMVPMAHANDGGGSIRIPAACCGLYGLKPTRGRNSLAPHYGDVAAGLLCEHVVTRSVRDSARLLDLTAGPVAGDPYAAPAPEGSFAGAVSGSQLGLGRRLRIALSLESPTGIPVAPEVQEATRRAAALCESLGHSVEEAAPVVDGEAMAKRFALVWVSFVGWNVRYWARRLGKQPRESDFEPSTWRAYLAAERRTPGDYLLALTDLQAASRAVAALLETYDAWLTPTAARPPAPLGYLAAEDTATYVRRVGEFSHLTLVANVTGQPAMSVPLAVSEAGLPIGAHFTGRFGEETTLLALAAELEAAAPWSERRPAVHA